MGIATDLVRFFQISNGPVSDNVMGFWAISDFLKKHERYYTQINDVIIACARLSSEGLLIRAGTANGSPPLCDCYYSTARLSDDQASYGFLDFLVFGFPLIRNHFEKSVLPLVVTMPDGQPSIGTGFLINGNRFITAAHCVKNMQAVEIPGWSISKHRLKSIYIPTDQRIDIAVLTFDADPFPNTPKFMMQSFNVLDEVLSMGYPPIPGFQDFLIAETANVAGYLKSTVGQAVTSAHSYLDNQNYILISARVKGGNSGGPVINRTGGVIGVVTAVLEEDTVTDNLGYGIAIPQDVVIKFLDHVYKRTAEVHSLDFQVNENVITTLENQ